MIMMLQPLIPVMISKSLQLLCYFFPMFVSTFLSVDFRFAMPKTF